MLFGEDGPLLLYEVGKPIGFKVTVSRHVAQVALNYNLTVLLAYMYWEDL